jgi:plastocyanin
VLTLVLVSFIFLLAPKMAVSATVAGKVTFDGTPPPPKVLQVTKDIDKCGPEQPSEALVVDADKGVQYVVVSIVNAPSGKREKDDDKDQEGKKEEKHHEKVVLDQQRCRFTPHVLLVPAGAELIVQNSDGIAHNLHTMSKNNPAINKAQPGFMKTMSIRTLRKPETIKVQCDMHNWMQAWVVVVDNPYTVVTDATGRFTLPDVPAGTYTLKFWHETLGEKQQQVTVQDGETATVDVVMGLP